MRVKELCFIKKIMNWNAFIQSFYETEMAISLIFMLIPYTLIGENPLTSDQIFSTILTLYVFEFYGNLFFSKGLPAYT